MEILKIQKITSLQNKITTIIAYIIIDKMNKIKIKSVTLLTRTMTVKIG